MEIFQEIFQDLSLIYDVKSRVFVRLYAYRFLSYRKMKFLGSIFHMSSSR